MWFARLTDLIALEGDRAGQRNRASQGATSDTSVPPTLDAILAIDHAINAYPSVDQIDVSTTCGEIGAVVAPDGSLTTDLREQGDSGYTGIASLGPGADGASIDVTMFLAEAGVRARGGNSASASAPSDDILSTPDAMAGMDMSGDATPAPQPMTFASLV